MREYSTDAVVLGVGERNGYDRFVDLYTEEIGRVRARVVAGRKITSKLSPHLSLGNFISSRLVYKNQFTLADALVQRVFSGSDILGGLSLVNSLAPVMFPDLQIWDLLRQGLYNGRCDHKVFLSAFGYDATYSSCDLCGANEVKLFFLPDQMFLCNTHANDVPRSKTVSI